MLRTKRSHKYVKFVIRGHSINHISFFETSNHMPWARGCLLKAHIYWSIIFNSPLEDQIKSNYNTKKNNKNVYYLTIYCTINLNFLFFLNNE